MPNKRRWTIIGTVAIDFEVNWIKELDTSEGRRAFESTRWSVVLLAGQSELESRDALTQLFEMYWYPIYSFVRSKHSEHHDAMDLTQGFFTHLLETNGLATVHPDKGRFRSFLLASVKNYMANQWRKDNAARRGGGLRQFSIDDAAYEHQYQRQLSMSGTPEEQYERNWISTLLSRVVERLRDDYVRADKEELFNAIQPWLVTTADRLPQNDIAEQLDMSLGAVAMSIHRLRRRYAELVREEVAHTVADPEDVEDELTRMLALLH